MTSNVYVPLHCHTDFSILDGLQSVGDYLDHCEECGFKAAALTDHGTCQGLEQFEWYAIKNKLHVKPIFGIETYFTEDVNDIMTDRIAKTKAGKIKYDKNGEPLREKQKPSDFNHGCLWAQNQVGLENLFKLSTLAYKDGFYYKPRIDLKMLAEHHEGLFISDGCMLSQVSRAIVADKPEKAYEWYGKLIDIFGKENVLVELHTWQFCEPRDENQRTLNANMRKTNLGKIVIARDLGLRMIAVNDAHYAKQSDWKMHDLAWATTTGKGADFNSDKFEGRGATADWVMTDDEVRYWLGKHDVPADVIEEAIQNTSWVADRCNAKLDRKMKPPRFMATREEDEELFDKTVMDGFRELVPKKKYEEYLDKLNSEVELIHKMDLTGYFNIVSDYANFVRAEDPDGEKYGVVGKHASLLGSGRGSAGGSLICYLMHITNVDPIKFGLFFERFLTAGRVASAIHLKFGEEWKTFGVDDIIKTEHGNKEAWQCVDEHWDTEFGKVEDSNFDFADCPDIDLDFEASIIPQLNEYLGKKYGYYGFAQIGTQLQSKLTLAFKDIAKVNGMDDDDVKAILVKMREIGIDMDTQRHELNYEDDFKSKIDSDSELKAFNDETGMLDDAWNWAGHYRAVGIHASGYVISRESMFGKMPLRIKDGKLITEFEHDGVARLGFIKFDVLKLSALGTIRLCYEQVHGSIDVQDIYRIMRDEKLLANQDMWKQTWNGDTLGIFQMDTPLGNKTAMNAKITSLRDAGMLSAADRPGLVRSGLINDFYKVRLGLEPVKHYHPMLDDILDETDGFILYQEQIMKIYQKICNMSLGETDYVRKVFTKKRVKEVEKMKQRLYDACMSSEEFLDGVPSNYDSPDECFNDLWHGLSRTAEYAFNKSHCLSGYEKVRLDTGEVITLSELYKRYENGDDLNVMQMLPDGSVAPGHIAEVIDSGLKEVLTITLEDKTVIRATPEHRFLTTRGYVAVKDFIEGEELIVDKSNSYAQTSLSEAMKKTQSMMTHEQRCIHQQNIQKLHPDRFDAAQKAAQRSLKKLRQDPEWRKKYSRAMSEGQKEYWSAIEDRKNARNWSGWTFQHSWDKDKVKEHYREQGKKASAFYKNASDEWVKSWMNKIKATKRANGTTNFGHPTKLSDGRLCDSKFEAEVGQYLLDRGIEFEVHKVVKTADGHRRMTDFYVDGLYIECDGLYRGEQYFRDKKYGDDLPFVVLYPNSWKYVIDQMLMSSHISNGVRVKSIEKKPIKGRWHRTYCRTYDIVMDDHCPANFIVNGIVSHNSLAYGMITSIEEYFKYNWPAEFICAYMNIDQDPAGLTYAKVHGINVSPPNVNKSKMDYVYDKQTNTLFMPLWAIKGVGGAAVNEIVDKQPYSSFDDYLDRTSSRGGKKKDVLTSLISLGAFDGVDPRDRFDLMVEWKTMKKEEPPKRNTWKNPRIRGKIEESLLGISLSYDPVFDEREWLESNGPQDIAHINEVNVGDWVDVAGQIVQIRKHQQKNGKTMAWISVRLVSHEEVQVTMFGNQFEKYRDMLSTNDIVKIGCKRTEDFNGKLSLVAINAVNHSLEVSE